MLDQLRLESYGFCCKMRVDSAVSLLGWVGIIISTLGLMAGIALVNVPSSDYSLGYPPSTIIKVGIVVILVSLALLIPNMLVLDQKTAGSFNDVKGTLRLLGNFVLSLQLIASLINCYWAYWGTNHLTFNSILIIILELISITIASIGILGVM